MNIPELLAFADNELKGELKPAEAVVSHTQLVAASRTHNAALTTVHSAIIKLQKDLDEMSTALSKRMDNIEAKVDQWGVRVEDLEKRCVVCEILFVCNCLFFSLLFHLFSLLD